ncbi:hypothetical protein FJTKL_03320 [Diaporthe vaccinii]|uniref:Uncharacterized protein n=1 Tax=Diaporthe vaccinii TaxID=105482 RepID=A0ABR4F1R4_9PEZI
MVPSIRQPATRSENVAAYGASHLFGTSSHMEHRRPTPPRQRLGTVRFTERIKFSAHYANMRMLWSVPSSAEYWSLPTMYLERHWLFS